MFSRASDRLVRFGRGALTVCVAGLFAIALVAPASAGKAKPLLAPSPKGLKCAIPNALCTTTNGVVGFEPTSTGGVTITRREIVGDQDFSLTNLALPQTCPVGVLPSGSACSLTVRFDPVGASGRRSATLELDANNGTSFTTTRVKLTGVAP